MEAMNIINEIQKVIDWYNKECHTAPIETLLAAQDKLSTLSWYLAQETADIKTDYNTKYFTRKIAVSKQKQTLMQTMTGVQAEAEAVNDNADKFRAEQEAEALAYRLDLLLKQTNKVISSLSQRISYMKTEQQQTKVLT